MFGALKKLFSKPAKEEQIASSTPDHTRAAAYSAHKPAATAPSPPAGSPGRPAPAAAPASQSRPAAALAVSVAHVPAHETVALPLTAIVTKLPGNVSSLAMRTAGVTFHLPAQTAVAQLPGGKVRIPFGQLRTSVPPGTFAENPAHDDVMIELPLQAILASMNPAWLARRPQRKVDVPDEVTSIFGTKFKMKFEAAVATPASTPVAAAPVAPPAPQPAAPPPPLPVVPTPAPLPAIAPITPLAPPSAAAAPARPPLAPQRPVAPPSAPSPLPFAQKPGVPSPGKLPSMGARPAAPAPPPPAAAPAVPISPIAPAPVPAASIAAAVPTAAVPAAAAAVASGVVQVPLSDIMADWPDPVRQEIAHGEWDLSLVVIPANLLEPGMKTGHVVFTWGDIRKFLVPPPGSIPSPNAETPLELPLKIIAPLFIAARSRSAQRKVAVAESIPDVFTNLKKGAIQTAPVPAAPVAPLEAAPIPTPAAPAPAPAADPVLAAIPPALAPAAPTPIAPAPAAPVPTVSAAPRPDALGTLFGQPLKSDWRPTEIVQKICALNGVGGCIVASADGLLIAGQAPPPQKAEMLASFMPQIFTRMTQYSGEMQIGALAALHLTTAEAPCSILKAGKLFLGVTGRAGETLPEAQLLRIATELAKRNP